MIRFRDVTFLVHDHDEAERQPARDAAGAAALGGERV